MDVDRVMHLIREVATAEIVPRFRSLAAGDIREKKPGDLVTIADIEAERRLTAALEAAAPGTVAIGEESVAADPALLECLAGEVPVWIIDPIDGTGNFAKGRPRFAVIVAYVEGGVTNAGWIYDPLGRAMVWAQRRGGAFLEGNQLRLGGSASDRRFAGSAYGRTAADVRAAKALTDTDRFAVKNHGCSGYEYMELARGGADFTLHSRSLPWDHAAGMLIIEEAGGVARFLDGSSYDPRVLDRKPLAAASAAAWQAVAAVMTAPAPTAA
ncbi:MAG: inositol monophosphatase family protein [Stellaceae bacterium]